MSMLTKFNLLVVSVLVLAGGCDQDDDNDEGHDDSKSFSTSSMSTTSSSTTQCSSTSMNETSSTSSTTTTDVAVCDTKCQVLGGDCPEGTQCVPYLCDPNNGPAWDSTVCAPPGPKKLGESCVNPWDGVAEEVCGEGLMCWSNVCRAQCTGTTNAPKCESQSEVCLFDQAAGLAVCMERCDPFVSTCPDGDVCIPAGIGDNAHAFACIGAINFELPKQRGEECQFLNGCAPGLYCSMLLGPGAVDAPGCDVADGCCTPFCPLDDDTFECPSENETCVPALTIADPGYENVGWCLVRN